MKEMKIVEHHFVEVTAEDLINDGSKKNKDKCKPTRSPIETCSRTSAKTQFLSSYCHLDYRK
jgi:hypothetical protein